MLQVQAQANEVCTLNALASISMDRFRRKGFIEAMRCTDGGEHCVFRRE
jgi:hypothetical protein